jgi:hypothetical protein
MNEIQKAYATAKAAYETAFEAKNWELVDQLEDAYIEAQLTLIDWTIEQVEKTGLMPKEDIEFIRKNMNNEQMDKIAEMGLRLQA